MARFGNAASFEEEKRLLLGACHREAGVTLKALRQVVGRAFRSASDEVRNDREVVLAVVGVDGRLLLKCSPKLYDDEQVALQAVRSTPAAYKFVSDRLQADFEFTLKCVKNGCGHELGLASENFRRHRDLVLAAVERFGPALQFASEELQGDKEVVMAAVARDGTALRWASPDLQADKDVVLAAVGSHGQALKFASQTIQAEREVVLRAVQSNYWALELASRTLQTDQDMVMKALHYATIATEYSPFRWADFLRFVSPTIHRSKDALLLGLRMVPSTKVCRYWLYDQAPKTLRDSVSWESLRDASQSSLAVQGEEAPSVTITLTSVGQGSYKSEVTLPTGATVVLTTRDSGDDSSKPKQNISQSQEQPPAKRQRTAPVLTLNEYVKQCLGGLAPHWKEGQSKPERLFVSFQKGKSVKLPVTPWEWSRPLTDFVHVG